MSVDAAPIYQEQASAELLQLTSSMAVQPLSGNVAHFAGKLKAGPSGLKAVVWYSAGPGELLRALPPGSGSRPAIE
jgi:hypothetical protein